MSRRQCQRSVLTMRLQGGNRFRPSRLSSNPVLVSAHPGGARWLLCSTSSVATKRRMVHQPVDGHDQQPAHQCHQRPEKRSHEKGRPSFAIETFAVLPDGHRQSNMDDQTAGKERKDQKCKNDFHGDKLAAARAVQTNRLSRRLFDTTDTLLSAIAAAANIGGSITPSHG